MERFCMGELSTIWENYGMIITFVVLHYETVNDTKKCIASLKKYQNSIETVNIVVVDNGSVDGKLNSKDDMFEENDIYLISSEKNLGYANGNNLGFVFAKYELQSDIIVLSNNDIVFEQENFIGKLVHEKEKTEFDVAGPCIMSFVDGKNQNPVPYLYPDIDSVRKRKIKYQILYVLSIINADILVQKMLAKEIQEYSDWNVNDYQLHGACLFFSNRFIKMFDGLYSGTFMYMEEGILKYITKKYGLKMQYINSLEVWHKEKSATNQIYGKGKEKRQFYYKWNIDGCNHLIELMKKNESWVGLDEI